mmetsp:Transcript_5781/g.20032  ORF Transcript_5781/g.20032 Transcript_5781/m.20032 type:complete len:146 (+) Transcript_5781:151-588(+)
MTNRPMPSRPSHYVSSVLRPLGELQKSSVSGDLMAELRDFVARKVTAKYDETAEDLLRTVQQTESSLKRLKERQTQGAGEVEGAAAKASDADKIRLQLFLDVQEYGRQLEKLGIDLGREATPEYHDLWRTVAPDGKKDEVDLGEG